MICPVCITFGVQTETTTVVNGTQYCSPHGVEALNAMMGPGRSRAQRGPVPPNPDRYAPVQGAFSQPPASLPTVVPTEPLPDAPPPEAPPPTDG